MKIVYTWKIDLETGKSIEKYPTVDFNIPNFDEDDFEDTTAIAIIMSIENMPRVYVYWKNSKDIIEIDPIEGKSVKFNKTR